jgi:fumarylacetoacetase
MAGSGGRASRSATSSSTCRAADLLDEEWREELAQPVLNAWLARGPADHRGFASACPSCCRRALPRRRRGHLIGQSEARMHLPCLIGDYTDFYVGIHHATNVGKQFRPDNPLLPNYKYVPIGYHGRASSVRASGEPVVRPSGQRKPPEAEAPNTARRAGSTMSWSSASGSAAAMRLASRSRSARRSEHIAGYCLLNDWSARDLQAWEYQPLGPFLAKNFLTSVSPWVVTPEALAPFRTADAAAAGGDPEPLPYLAMTDRARAGSGTSSRRR